MRAIGYFLIVLSSLLGTVAMAGDVAGFTSEDIDRYVMAEMRRQHIPGLQLGIYRRGEIVATRGFGLANTELQVPVHPATVFQSGSMGKQFVAAAILMLSEQGKIDLNASITRYLPKSPGRWKPILVKNLLSHTSGLAEYEDGALIEPGGPFYLRMDLTEDELLTRIQALPIEAPVGTKWDYRNTNYVLLGIIIHKLTGMFYGDFLTEKIFRPLGMSSTRGISEADIIPNRASGYELRAGELRNQEWVSPTFNSTADGTLYFNVLDLAKWDRALYGNALLQGASMEQWWTVFRLNDGTENPVNYGFGWLINRINGRRVVEHGGAWQGFTSHISRYLDDGVTVVVLTNLDGSHCEPEIIAHNVAGMVDSKLASPLLDPIDDRNPDVTSLLSTAIREIISGNLTVRTFAPDYLTSATRDELSELAIGLKSLGPVQATRLLKIQPVDSATRYRYRLETSNTTRLARITVDKEGKVAALLLSYDPDAR